MMSGFDSMAKPVDNAGIAGFEPFEELLDLALRAMGVKAVEPRKMTLLGPDRRIPGDIIVTIGVFVLPGAADSILSIYFVEARPEHIFHLEQSGQVEGCQIAPEAFRPRPRFAWTPRLALFLEVALRE